MALRADQLPLTAAAQTPSPSITLHRAALWGLLFSKLVGGWGVQWDIQWHVLIGRDSFWIPPHLMTYAGVTLAVLLSFGVLGWDTLVAANSPRAGVGAAEIRVAGFTSTPGFHLAAWGIALTVVAASIDDLWHRLFGRDVTVWSPPHLLGILGSVVNTVACLSIAREVYPAQPGARLLATVVSGAMLYGNLHLIVDPSNLVAYRHGGVRFYTLAMLSAIILPLALVTTARLSGTRWAPVLLLLVLIPMGMTGAKIAQIGFEVIQPVSVIQDEIAKDPDSPIALAYTIARKNGTTPGRTGGILHVYALLAAAVMGVVDARKRPIAATLGYAGTLFAVLGWVLSHRPALAPLAPGPAETALALGLTPAAAFVGGSAARWLSDALARSSDWSRGVRL